MRLARRNHERHRDLVGEEVPEVNGHLRQRLQRAQVELLLYRLVGIARARGHQGGKVLDGLESIAGQQELAELIDIDPPAWGLTQCPIEKIEPVDVDIGAQINSINAEAALRRLRARPPKRPGDIKPVSHPLRESSRPFICPAQGAVIHPLAAQRRLTDGTGQATLVARTIRVCPTFYTRSGPVI